MTEFKWMTPTQLSELQSTLDRYSSVLTDKEKLNDEETSLWFEFMTECHNNYNLMLYAFQEVCRTLADGLNTRYLILPDKGKDCNGNDNYIAFGYEEGAFGWMDWTLKHHSIDTDGWATVIKGDDGKFYRVPVRFQSAGGLLPLLAALRGLNPKTATFKPTL